MNIGAIEYECFVTTITNIEFCSSIEGEPSYKDPDAQKKDKWEASDNSDEEAEPDKEKN